MTNDQDDLLDDLFHGCALAAYLDQMHIEQRWPPDCEATRLRAFRYYEEALAEKNRQRETSTAQVGKVLTMPANRARLNP